MAGATTFGQLIAGAPTWVAKVGAAGVTLIALVQAVLRLGSAAEMHRQWLRRWNALTSELEGNPHPKESDIRKWLAAREAIESDCVAELLALTVDCENAASRFMDLPGRQRKIRWWQRLIIQVGTLQRHFPYEADLKVSAPHEPPAAQ